MAKRISPNELSDTIKNILDEYGNDIIAGANEATKKVAEYGARELKERAIFAGIKGHKYTNSFRSELLQGSRLGNTYVIRSTEYRLAHLLEHGHAIVVHGKRTGKRTRAFHHWTHVEDDVNKKLEQEIKDRIQQTR